MGRDNKMYHLNDGYNLELPKKVNIFDNLVHTKVYQERLLNNPSQTTQNI